MNNTRKQQKKLLKRLMVMLLMALVGTAVTIYNDYNARPGFLEKVWIYDRGSDYITVAWEKARNVDKYVIMYDGKTVEASGREQKVKINGLSEDTVYDFSVRADSKKRKGFETLSVSARTKKQTHIIGEESQMKFANRPADLKQTAETSISYSQGSGYTVTENGEIIFDCPGEIIVTATTTETDVYASVSKEITVLVLDTVNETPKGTKPHIFYTLNRDNCECLMTVTGTDEIPYPQSFAYDDGRYIISFINKDEIQRIISFGDHKDVYEPEMDLGHANGLTIADGICYSVRGGNSTQCISFDPDNTNYSSFNLEYPASGIAYDETAHMFYTSSRKNLVAYDQSFNFVGELDRVKRSGTYYVQDCGAYGGILMQSVSGEDAQGTNYIDFYNMTESTYLGSIECELNEVESLIVDDEGFIELLSIYKRPVNYIWKTPINVKMLCE